MPDHISSLIKLQYDDKKGYYYIATNEIKSGTTIIKEKPLMVIKDSKDDVKDKLKLICTIAKNHELKKKFDDLCPRHLNGKSLTDSEQFIQKYYHEFLNDEIFDKLSINEIMLYHEKIE